MRPHLLLATFAALVACPANRQDAAVPDTHPGLAGTSWQRVEIVSMDDSVYTPDTRSRYTVAFRADGSVRIRAGCNRGTGSWTSASPGQLQFGDIATTRALCPPGSQHDRYQALFRWVRSCVRQDGHLFLATLADGSSSEFEPLPER